MTNQTQALVPRREVGGVLVPEVIVDANDFNKAVDQWNGSQQFNLLCPVLHLSTVPASHEITVSEVHINPNPKTGGDVYNNPLFCKSHEVALSVVGLSKIAQCAGMSTQARRVDDRTLQYYWEYEATAEFLGFDGTPISITRGKEWDLRDGSFRLKGFTAAQIEQARANGQANAESRAINRAIRQYGIKQKYTLDEIARPFIVARLRWVPDMTNPHVAAMVTQLRMGGASKLFAGVTPAPALPEHAGGDPATVATTPPELRTPAVSVERGPVAFDVAEDKPEPEKPPAPVVVYRLKGVWKNKHDRFFTRAEELGDTPLYVETQQMAEALKDLYELRRYVTFEVETRGDEKWITEFSDGGAIDGGK